MTNAAAIKKAKELWGNKAAVQAYPSGRHLVGYVNTGVAFAVCGAGRSWEEAFKDAKKGVVLHVPPTEKKKLTRKR